MMKKPEETEVMLRNIPQEKMPFLGKSAKLFKKN